MGRISEWAIRRPIIALLAWLVAILGAGALAFTAGGTFNDTFSLPNTQSAVAQALLEEVNPSQSSASTATVVWSPATGSVLAEDVKKPVTALLRELAALPGVDCIVSPYGDRLGPNCPAAPSDTLPPDLPPDIADSLNAALDASKKATSTISTDERVAYAQVTFTGVSQDVVDPQTATDFMSQVSAANTADLQVGATGQVLTAADSEPPTSELVGIIAAVVILLIAFGSLVAAGMPIIVALAGLVTGQFLIVVIARYLDVASFAPQLASMIGLGVGIDYSLFILNRYRQDVQAGMEPKQAISSAVQSAGRAVLFAGSTVIIALLGLFVLGVSFFYGLAISAALTVLLVMLAALVLLPAIASLLGRHMLGIRMPWARRQVAKPLDESRWAGYGSLLQRAPWLSGILALGVVLTLAVPALSLQQGFPDNGSAAPGSPARVGFDLMDEGFGPGSNGPFFVAVSLPLPIDYEVLDTVLADLESTPGVASTVPNRDMIALYQYATVGGTDSPYSENGIVTSVLVTPTTGPDDPATNELLQTLRAATSAKVATTGAAIYVGGTQAVTQDFTTVLIDVLPLFLTVVIGLGFLALMMLFRSIVIPLTAAITSLLSFAAALGVTVAVFQWGWGASLIGVTATGPILPFLPIMVFAILFGLSMDYQVFLVSRMQEGWHATHDNREAVRHGLAGSGRVVVAAALIMSSVFIAFVPTPNDTIKLFGVALASAVLIDAFLVRLVIVPSVMSMLGRANWWIPKWLDKILPELSVEGPVEKKPS